MSQLLLGSKTLIVSLEWNGSENRCLGLASLKYDIPPARSRPTTAAAVWPWRARSTAPAKRWRRAVAVLRAIEGRWWPQQRRHTSGGVAMGVMSRCSLVKKD